MSKSIPDSAIFMEDTLEDIKRKVNNAFCPEGEVYDDKGKIMNPLIDYCSSVVFPKYGKMTIPRKEENGGDVTYNTLKELTTDFEAKNLHPGDLKSSLITYLDRMIEPVRAHFINDPIARELLKVVKTLRVTKVK